MFRAHLIPRTAATVVLLGAALLIGAGPLASTAEAGKKRTRKTAKVERHRGDDRQVRQHRVERREKHRTVDRHRDDYRAEHRSVKRRHVERRQHRRPVVRHTRHVTHHRPWYRSAQRIHVHHNPFYFHTGLGIYLGGAYINFEFGNYAPDGYVFYDPYCHEQFYSVDAYHDHLRYHRHRAALRVMRLEVCGY